MHSPSAEHGVMGSYASSARTCRSPGRGAARAVSRRQGRRVASSETDHQYRGVHEALNLAALGSPRACSPPVRGNQSRHEYPPRLACSRRRASEPAIAPRLRPSENSSSTAMMRRGLSRGQNRHDKARRRRALADRVHHLPHRAPSRPTPAASSQGELGAEEGQGPDQNSIARPLWRSSASTCKEVIRRSRRK